MKIPQLILALLIFSSFSTQETQNIVNLPLAQTPSFLAGEYLEYRVHYGLITAGTAKLTVKKSQIINGQTVHHVIGKGESQGLTELLFKTRDHYESYIRKSDMQPVEFIRDVNEGGYITKRHIYFDPDKKKARDILYTKDSVFEFKNNIQDLFSLFYFARSLDLNSLKNGDQIPIDVFIDHEVYTLNLVYNGKEKIKNKNGKIKCLKFKIIAQKGRVFGDEESAFIWISDDDNKIPILVKSELFIGSIKMELSDYKNVANPFVFK